MAMRRAMKAVVMSPAQPLRSVTFAGSRRLTRVRTARSLEAEDSGAEPDGGATPAVAAAGAGGRASRCAAAAAAVGWAVGSGGDGRDS